MRIASVLGVIAATTALSGPSCGGDVLLAPPVISPPEPEAGTAAMTPADAEPLGEDGGPSNPVTVPPSANPGPSEDASAPPVDAPSGSTEPIVLGSGAPCSPSATLFVGTKISVSTAWPASAAVAKGSGPFFLWFLAMYVVSSTGEITGKTTTCGMQMPMVTFSAIGDMAVGVPSGQTGLQEIVVPATSLNGVPTVNITGTLGGWNVGSSVAIDPVVTLYGLKSTSSYADASTPWPVSESSIASSDLTYADGMPYQAGAGLAGIVGYYDSTPPYYPWTTSLAMNSPRADHVAMVLRTQLQLYGTSSSCTTQSGQAFVSDLNVRIVGCQLAGTDGSDGLCTASQYGFVDSNTTQFAPGNGTFTSQVLATGASCADVLSALP